MAIGIVRNFNINYEWGIDLFGGKYDIFVCSFITLIYSSGAAGVLVWPWPRGIVPCLLSATPVLRWEGAKSVAAPQCEHVLRGLHQQWAEGEKHAVECKEAGASLWNILLSIRSAH